jgi:hypothetical protein
MKRGFLMSNEMKLYHSAASPNSRRVRMFLAEKGIAIPLVTVDLAKGEQHSDAYRAINPRRLVPTLVLEDGTAIGEVLAIWRYLEEAYPTPPLLGSTPKRPMVDADALDQPRFVPSEDGRTSDVLPESLAFPFEVSLGAINRFICKCEGIVHAARDGSKD